MDKPTYDFGPQAFAEFWQQAGKTAKEAQEGAARAFADSFKSIPGLMQAGSPFALSAVVPDSAELTQAAKAVSELWGAAVAMSGSLSTTMASAGRGMDPTLDASFRAIADPRSWFASAGGLDTVIARMADSPQLADLWDAERQQARLLQAWLEMRRHMLAHNAVVLDAWLRAGQAFQTALVERTRSAGQAPDGRALIDLWTSTANAVLLETQRAEKFLATQAAMLRAGAELRLAQRNLAERWAEKFDMPTRTELDEVHRTVTELRRELRDLRRETKARWRPATRAHSSAAAGEGS